MNYRSSVTKASKVMEGVTFEVVRMSFERRIHLTERIRELGMKTQYLEAGEQLGEKLEAAVLSQRIESLYLEWGLRAVNGLEIDGEPATPIRLLEVGPEELCREIVREIKAECGLSDEERKN